VPFLRKTDGRILNDDDPDLAEMSDPADRIIAQEEAAETIALLQQWREGRALIAHALGRIVLPRSTRKRYKKKVRGLLAQELSRSGG